MPFYNVEPYIEGCIRSLYDQDIPQSEYEVICVDDCSPDGSRAIVERLQKQYPTLKLLIHTENKRQGGARNTGLREAQGRYIWFVDSDDYIKPNCLKGLLDQAERENLDILKFHFAYENRQLSRELAFSEKIESGTDLIFREDLQTPLIMRCCSAVSQIIKRNLLDENEIKFAENVQYEDDDFAYQIYAYARRARLIPIAPYLVRMSPNSTTRRSNDYRRVIDMYAQALRVIALEPLIIKQDSRWRELTTNSINDCVNNNILWILKTCTLCEQLRFWYIDCSKVKCFRPYISHRSYAKLRSYLCWLIWQK